MPRIRVILKSGKIDEFAEQAPINNPSQNTVEYEGPVCIVKHACGTKRAHYPLADVKRVEVDQ